MYNLHDLYNHEFKMPSGIRCSDCRARIGLTSRPMSRVAISGQNGSVQVIDFSGRKKPTFAEKEYLNQLFGRFTWLSAI